jgi:hypothetical protein
MTTSPLKWILNPSYIICLCTFLGTTLAAQDFTIRGITAEKLATPLCEELNKIIADYPNNFKSIKGETIKRNEYSCKVVIPGAEETLLLEKVDEDFDVILVYSATFSQEIPWKQAEQKVYEIGEDIGGCAKAGEGRFIHTIQDSNRKQVSLFLPYQPEKKYENLQLRLSISKKVTDDVTYGVIRLVIGQME